MNYNATCAITGKKGNLRMHSFRDENGNMIGWVFISEEISENIDEFKIEVTSEWKHKTKSLPITDFSTPIQKKETN